MIGINLITMLTGPTLIAHPPARLKARVRGKRLSGAALFRRLALMPEQLHVMPVGLALLLILVFVSLNQEGSETNG